MVLMHYMLKIAMVGCGAIGTVLARAVDKGGAGNTTLIAVYDNTRDQADKLIPSLEKSVEIMGSIEELLDTDADLIVEAASQEAVKEIAVPALSGGKDLMIMSVGALMDAELLNMIKKLAEEKGCKIYLPSGAIAGLDGIKSASSANIDSITITTRKPPAGLKGAPYVDEQGIDLDSLQEEQVLFEGSASKAVKLFPANVNVAAALSLSGIGPDKTVVKIIADPGIDRNIHEIEARGEFGVLRSRVENVPSPMNPRTSYLAALSAIATLRKMSDPVQIGT